MRLSEKQAMLLLEVLKESLVFAGGPVFALDRETRIALYEEILHQQSETVVELDPEQR